MLREIRFSEGRGMWPLVLIGHAQNCWQHSSYLGTTIKTPDNQNWLPS